MGRDPERPRRVLATRRLAAAAARRSRRRARRRLGRDREQASATRCAAKAQARGVEVSPGDVQQATRDSVRALMLIRAYRMRGHLHANLDPLGLEPAARPRGTRSALLWVRRLPISTGRSFSITCLALSSARCARSWRSSSAPTARRSASSSCTSPTRSRRGWLQERIEGPDKEITFTREGKRAILNKLVEAEGFEKFCDVKFTGTKRFGLDGGESMIPALEQIIKRGGALGVKDIALGMAHRGRLNVLAQVLAKPHRAIFHEFKGGSSSPDDVDGSGDVKYHLGASSDREFDQNKVHLSLTANPSHLEIVNPVVLGKTRAKQDQLGATPDDRTCAMPLLISGDAAFAGQGVVAECFGLSGLRGHRTGGSVHFIVNNQIGFTTYPRYSRSSPYPSDVAKMIEAPIFHANGDDPEAVVFAAKIATEFRQKFQKPVVIDMFCYRRHGHNEGDEPMFTQPLMYKTIAVASDDAGNLRQEAHRRGRRHRGRSREDEERLARPARCRAGGEPELSRQQGRLARRPLGRASRSPTCPTIRAAAIPASMSRCWRISAARSRRRRRTSTSTAPSQRFLDARRKAIESGAGNRLGDRGGAGLLFAAARRPSGPAVGPGLRARHLLAAPFGADRPGERRPLHAVQSHRAEAGALRGHQLDALRGGGARLRIRLFARRAQRARPCGRRSSAISPMAPR